MYNLKNIIIDTKDIPEEWIYKYYLRLLNREITSKFDGRLIRTNSPWTRDTNPSFYIFFKDGNYLWKDFSCGVGGNCYSLVQRILNCPYAKAVESIKNDAYLFVDGGGNLNDYSNKIQVLPKRTYKIVLKPWDESLLNKWTEFKITIKTLQRRRVFPIRSYEIFEDGVGVRCWYTSASFAYYSNKGAYKIYNPGVSPKYLSVDTKYICGLDQLKYNKDVLIIQSGLKDICAIDELDLDVESIAPDSESTMLQPDLIRYFKTKYKFILTLFDNDKTGNNMSKIYQKRYDTIPIYTNMGKDIAIDLRDNDGRKLREIYSFLINKRIQ